VRDDPSRVRRQPLVRRSRRPPTAGVGGARRDDRARAEAPPPPHREDSDTSASPARHGRAARGCPTRRESEASPPAARRRRLPGRREHPPKIPAARSESARTHPRVPQRTPHSPHRSPRPASSRYLAAERGVLSPSSAPSPESPGYAIAPTQHQFHSGQETRRSHLRAPGHEQRIASRLLGPKATDAPPFPRRLSGSRHSHLIAARSPASYYASDNQMPRAADRRGFVRRPSARRFCERDAREIQKVPRRRCNVPGPAPKSQPSVHLKGIHAFVAMR
jgi:hypothetical protein